MNFKRTITVAIMTLNTSVFAQTNLFNENNIDSEKSITFVEVPQEKAELPNNLLDNIIEEKEPVLTLKTLKSFCESNVSMFDKNIEIVNKSEEARYIDDESIEDYCARYVAILKLEAKENGYMIGNLYSKPVEQGKEVDDLWVSQGFGQGEGVIGYTKNEEVQVLTVESKNVPIQMMDLKSLDEKMTNQESLAEGESLIEEPVVVNTNEQIKEIEKKPSTNYDILQNIIKNNELIGKILKTEPHEKGDIDMSQIIELLPPNMRSFHIRVIAEGKAVTLDFRDNRLNIALDKNNKIKNINIG